MPASETVFFIPKVMGENKNQGPIPVIALPNVPPSLSHDISSCLTWMAFIPVGLGLGILTGLWLWFKLPSSMDNGTLSLSAIFLLFYAATFLVGSLSVIWGLLFVHRQNNAWVFIATGAFLLLIQKLFS